MAALDGSPALLERARSLAELGAALRRDGQRAAARDPLARALDLAARCGARPLAARAREELKAAGARPRRPWRTGVDALTPSELRVARLAAEGRSNREIAYELYVTLKAVEGHLARAYAKLGIEGRSQLARALGTRKRLGCRPGQEYQVRVSARKGQCVIEVVNAGGGTSTVRGSRGADRERLAGSAPAGGPVPATAEHGRGLMIINAVADNMQLTGNERHGTTVHFEKTLEWLPGAAGQHLFNADGGS